MAITHTQTLIDHPRLYINRQAWQDLPNHTNHPIYSAIKEHIQSQADGALDIQAYVAALSSNGHNWHLARARRIQKATWNLIVQYRLTSDIRYKQAVMGYVQVIHDWEYWSWLAWRQQDNSPTASFDLSYGENSLTLAIIHDWLHDDLTQADIELLLATIRRPVEAFRRLVMRREGQIPSNWFGRKDSNWNTVCAGGFGMLVLSFWEHLADAPELLEACEESIKPYMEELEKTNGAWPEGIGYWSYGMRYGFLYLLAYENATGTKHWALEQEGTKKSLYFPMDFCPNGVPCSFGDVNQWMPLPFHLLMAQRIGDAGLRTTVTHTIAQHLDRFATQGAWSNIAEGLLTIQKDALDQPDTPEQLAGVAPFVKLYEGQDWGTIADHPLKPKLYMAVRGGSTEVPHGHHDLTSFHAVVEDEPVILNQGISNGYLDSTFSNRRFDLYDTSPGSKNVMLVSGLGIQAQSTVETKKIRLASDIAGLNINASNAIGAQPRNSGFFDYRRTYLMIANQALLILDHFQAKQENRCEVRQHTLMAPAIHDQQPLSTTLRLQGKQHQAALYLASNKPSALFLATSLTTSPAMGPIPGKAAEDLHVVRYVSTGLSTHFAFATLIIPSHQPADINIQANEQGVSIQFTLPDCNTRTLKLTSDMTALQNNDEPLQNVERGRS